MKKNIFILIFLLSLSSTGQPAVGSDISQDMVGEYYIGCDAIRAWNTTAGFKHPESVFELTISLSEFTKQTLSDELLINLGESISLGKVGLNAIRNSLFPYASDLANYISSYITVGKKIVQHKLAH